MFWARRDGFAIFGSSEYDYFGNQVAILGDVNGDGFDDLAVGANGSNGGGASDTGAVYIIFGRASGFDDLYLSELDTASRNWRRRTLRRFMVREWILIWGNRLGRRAMSMAMGWRIC